MWTPLLFPASPPPTAVGKVSAQRKQPVLDGGGLYFLSGRQTRNLFISAMNSGPVCVSHGTHTRVSEGNTSPRQAPTTLLFHHYQPLQQVTALREHQAESLLTEPHITASCSFLLPFVTIKPQRKHFYFPRKANSPLSMWGPFKSI